MKAVVIDTLTGPASAHFSDDAPEPDVTHHRANGSRLLVEVRSVGLSPIDGLQARGAYQYGTPPPYTPGSEVAGVVVETDDASGFAVGDRVGSIVFWGGLAERAVAAPSYTVRLPESLSFDEGAATYLNYSTAWYAYERSGARPGDVVLVHGAAGGVGTAALDLAAEFGVRTIAVVSTDAKERVARECGAWQVLRSDGPWLDAVKSLTDGRGVHAVIDPVGGDRFTDSLRSLRIGGTLVVVGFVGGSIPEVKVNRLLLRNLTVTGVSMDSMDTERPGTLLRVRDSVQALLDAGRIHPRIGTTYPWEGAIDALIAVEKGTAAGKVIVAAPRRET